MFGGKFVSPVNGGIKGLEYEDSAVLEEASGCSFSAIQLGQLLFEFGQHIAGEGKRVGYENAGAGIVFGLAEDVGGNPLRLGLRVGNDEYITGAGKGIDIDHAVHLFFGQLDDIVAGADDFIYFLNGLGAEGQCGDSVGSAEPVHFCDIQFITETEDDRVDACLPAGRRDDNYFLYACRLGGNGCHNECARQGGTGAGNAKPHSLKGKVADSWMRGSAADEDLRLVKPHIFNGFAKGLQKGGFKAAVCFFQFFR